MSLVATLRALTAAGANAEMLIAVVEAHEAARDAKAAARREKDAARQKAKRARDAHAESRGHDVTSRDSRGPAPRARVSDNITNSENNHLAAAVERESANKHDDWPEGDGHAHLRRLVIEAASPRLDPAKTPGLITTLGRLAAWRRDGASWANEVVPVITTMARKRGPPIQTWKFFDAAIAQSIADNRKALTIPEARRDRPDTDRQPSARDDRLGRMLNGIVAAVDERKR